MPKAMATLDPMVIIFMVGTLGIVALGGMALGYDVNLCILDSGIQLRKPVDGKGARRQLVTTTYE